LARSGSVGDGLDGSLGAFRRVFDACAQHLPRRLILGLGIRRNGLRFLSRAFRMILRAVAVVARDGGKVASAFGFSSTGVGLEVCFDIYLSMIAREENAWPKETFARRRSRAADCD
jgi:hypothetical protein